jgi:hypothetical protein
MKANLLFYILLVLISCTPKKVKENNELMLSIKEHSLKPESYIIENFRTHDVIFIGENHYIKEQVELIDKLIPELYKNGIYLLGTEFIRYSDTDLMNKLITDSTYDEELAKKITFNSLWHWGYKEYLDIYKTAWELNQQLPKGSPKFRIFGIEEDTDFSYIKSEEDYANREIILKVFKSKKDFDEDEGLSAYSIQKEIIDKRLKGVIHCGIHHGFTKYYQPIVEDKKFFAYQMQRMGNLVRNKIGNKAMTIFLHGPWYDENGYENLVLPVEGILDSLFSIKSNKDLYPFGMNTKGTLLGELKGIHTVYQYGYPNFALKDFCDGYIFIKPVNEYNAVTPIKNFVKPENVDYIKQQELDYRNTKLTAENLNDTIKMWLNEFQYKLKVMKK